MNTLEKWRLFLGKDADPEQEILIGGASQAKQKQAPGPDGADGDSIDWTNIDAALNELYGETKKSGGLGKSSARYTAFQTP